MKFNLKFSLRKILNNKKAVIAISIVLAFVFWLAIVTTETPTIERTLTNVPITLETEGSIAGELALDEFSGLTQQTVSVKLSGPAYVLNQLSTEDIVISASVAEVTKPGEYELTLFANKKAFGSEYTVVSITPGVVTGVFDKTVKNKEFTVVPRITGVTPITGLVVGEPIISDAGSNVVYISGPQTEINKIAKVEALVETNEELSETKTYDGTIILYDESGKKLDNGKYTLSATTVKISQPILKSKTVPIKPTFLNAPSGYVSEPISSSLSIKEVNIAGSAATIDTITAIELSPIDFNEITKSNNTFDETLVIPSGVKVVDNIETVTVKINTDNISEKSFNVSKIVTTGDASGHNVKLNYSIKNVKICGPSAIIRTLKAEDLYAVVDLTDKGKGEYMPSVTIRSDKYPTVWAVGTYQASIRVE